MKFSQAHQTGQKPAKNQASITLEKTARSHLKYINNKQKLTDVAIYARLESKCNTIKMRSNRLKTGEKDDAKPKLHPSNQPKLSYKAIYDQPGGQPKLQSKPCSQATRIQIKKKTLNWKLQMRSQENRKETLKHDRQNGGQTV